jgi:hypothetical protein
MTYRWTPTSGCSTSTACATDQVSGNNAFQTSGGALPTYGATSGPNSTPALTFAIGDSILPTTPIAAPAGDFTIYVIFNMAAGSRNNELLGGAATSSINLVVSTSNQVTLNEQAVAGVNGNRALSTGTWYGEAVTYQNGSGTNSFYALSGGTATSDGVIVTPQSFTSVTTALGAAPQFSLTFDGSIAEWGYLTSANIAGIANWSSCHYGVQLGLPKLLLGREGVAA